MDATMGWPAKLTPQAQCLTAASSSTTLALPCTGRKKALLIGISAAKTEGYALLAAAHTDVAEMRALLIDMYAIAFGV